MIEPNAKGSSSKSLEKSFSCIEENKKSEDSIVLNVLKNESIYDANDIEENITNSQKCFFSAMHKKEISHISCDATQTQSMTPYVSSISSLASVRLTRNPLEIPSTSLSSNESTSRSEVQTFATNYNDSLIDTGSISVNTVNRHGIAPIFNRVPQLLTEETFDLARWNLPSTDIYSMNQTRQSRRTWGIRKSLCCFLRINEEIDVLPHSRGAPPTYSSTYEGPSAVSQEELSVVRAHIPDDRRYLFLPINHSSFVAPTPPPSYAQAQGIQLSSYPLEPNISFSQSNSSWPPRSTATICPRCIALVITATEIRRSTITHISAFLLCLCGCWPCCMIPYCLDSCKNIDHYCPVCRTYLGTYTPW